MKKETMLKKIAQKGYDVSYAANLNFATYDIVTKIPSVVSFLSIAIGIFGLVFESFRVVGVSVCILLLGIVNLYIERFTSNVDDYCKRGSTDTELLYRLKNLYFKIKDSDDTNSDFTEEEKEYEEIEKVYNNTQVQNKYCLPTGSPITRCLLRKIINGWTNNSILVGGKIKRLDH